MNAPSPLEGCNKPHLTWHKVESHNILAQDNIQAEIQINFGKFWKCGFYDWRVIFINGEGKLSTPLLVEPPKTHSFPISKVRSHSIDEGNYMDDDQDDSPFAQGRFVVHARGMRDHCFHEV